MNETYPVFDKYFPHRTELSTLVAVNQYFTAVVKTHKDYRVIYAMAIIYHTNLIVIGGLLSVFFDNSECFTDYRDKHTHQSKEYNEDKRHEEYLTKRVSTLKTFVIKQTVIVCYFLFMQAFT